MYIKRFHGKYVFLIFVKIYQKNSCEILIKKFIRLACLTIFSHSNLDPYNESYITSLQLCKTCYGHQLIQFIHALKQVSFILLVQPLYFWFMDIKDALLKKGVYSISWQLGRHFRAVKQTRSMIWWQLSGGNVLLICVEVPTCIPSKTNYLFIFIFYEAVWNISEGSGTPSTFNRIYLFNARYW